MTLFSDVGMVKGMQKFLHKVAKVNIITSSIFIKIIATVILLFSTFFIQS